MIRLSSASLSTYEYRHAVMYLIHTTYIAETVSHSSETILPFG